MKSTFLNIHEAIIVVTIVEIVFLCIALGFLSRKRTQSKALLIALFLLVAGTLGLTLIIWNPHLQGLYIATLPLLPALLTICLLLEGPALYAYLRSLSENLSLHPWQVFMHLLPAGFAALLIIVFDVSVLDWLPWNWPELAATKCFAIQVVWAMFKCLPMIYILACIYHEHQLRKKVKDLYSSVSALDIRMVDIILAGFFIHWFWSFAGYFISDYVSGEVNDWVGVVNNYVAVLLVNGLFLFAIINGRQLLLENDADSSDILSPITDLEALDAAEQKIAHIELVIATQKPYLDGQINLERFSACCELKPREVSVLLNRHYKKNFFEFINELRVEEVKKQLLEDEARPILEVAMAAGFNSHSAFQRFFKRFVGVSPSQYRRAAGIQPRSL